MMQKTLSEVVFPPSSREKWVGYSSLATQLNWGGWLRNVVWIQKWCCPWKLLYLFPCCTALHILMTFFCLASCNCKQTGTCSVLTPHKPGKTFLVSSKTLKKNKITDKGGKKKKRKQKISQTTKNTIWKNCVDEIQLKKKKKGKWSAWFLITIISLVETEEDFTLYCRRHGNPLILIYWICIYTNILNFRELYNFSVIWNKYCL